MLIFAVQNIEVAVVRGKRALIQNGNALQRAEIIVQINTLWEGRVKRVSFLPDIEKDVETFIIDESQSETPPKQGLGNL